MQSIQKVVANLQDEDFKKYILSEDLSTLHQLKLHADDLYYNTGKSSGLEDWKYDFLKEILTLRDPNYVIPTGTKIREKENRVNLPFWLGSMNKFKPEDEKAMIKWVICNKAKQYIIQDKLDGISCLLVIKNGNVKIYTRGDGIVGADISYLAKYIKNIPKKVKDSISVRGELIMKEKVFKENYNVWYANPRNMVAGVVSSKTMKEGINFVEFIAYEVVSEEICPSSLEQLNYLDSLGFKTVYRNVVTNFNVDSLMEALISSKKKSKYEIDGLIVQPNVSYERNTFGNPSYAFAFKMRFSDNLIEAKVLGVEWNVSKWGVLKPRVEINPVQLGGVTITWATGFNAKYIVEKFIGPGAVIQITRSGDVIPYIVSVIKKAEEPDMPDIPYTWNESNVDIQTDEYSDTSSVKRIASFFAELGIKHVGEKNVQKMYESGFDTLLKIIGASEDDFAKVPGFGKKMAQRTFSNIQEGLKDLPIPLLLGASGVFGFGMGTKKITTLLNDFPELLESSKTMKKEDIYERVLKVEGFSHKTSKKIVDNLEEAQKFILDIKKFATFKKEIVKNANDNLVNMKIVLSGFRDKKLEESIISRGGKVVTSVSKQTSMLVVASASSELSGKTSKALELGVKILELKEFMDQFINV